MEYALKHFHLDTMHKLNEINNEDMDTSLRDLWQRKIYKALSSALEIKKMITQY
jgi:hypothetical protein